MEQKKFSLVKPTVDTPFFIDFDWWKNHESNWHVFLRDYLCPEHQEIFSSIAEVGEIDWVDPVTGQISVVDGLQHVLINHCAKLEGFFEANTALVDSVFRILLANNNTPLTPRILSEYTGKTAETILQTLTRSQIYRGIRPCQA